MPTIRVGDIDIFYQDNDFADPWRPHDTVFMQHGFARNGNFWRGWVPWLAREYRVVRMDLRGCGRSGDPGPDYQYSLEDLLRDFTGLLDALGIDRVHYIGESLGGMFGIAASARYPERFKSLALVATGFGLSKTTPTVSSVGYPTWQDALQTLGMKEWRRRVLAETKESNGNPAEDEYFIDEIARTPVHVAVALSRFAPTVSLVDAVPRIPVPVFMLTPGASMRVSQEQQAGLARLIPNVRQKVYEGANHGMYHLMPDLLARDTLEFLRSVQSS